MKIFISWSGERSLQMGKALHDWIPLVLHYVDPWLSDSDIAAGERWAPAVAGELETCSFGIICLTEENLNSPWILFEAGALAKSVEESRLVPLALGLEISDIGPPLSQFQAKRAEHRGVREMIDSVNSTAQEMLPSSRIDDLFEMAWPRLEASIQAIPQRERAARPARSQSVILEELVARVRTLDRRTRELQQSIGRPVRGTLSDAVSPGLMAAARSVVGANDHVLSQLDVEILRLAARGLQPIDIGEVLGFTRSQMVLRLRRIYDKIGVNSPIEAAKWAIDNGYLSQTTLVDASTEAETTEEETE